MNLYPLKFNPIYKSKIWGGDRLQKVLNKNTNGLEQVGECWEISAVPEALSVVSNGSLSGRNITEVILQHKTDVVGSKVYQKFGSNFPLLVKFIDANDYLSIQVHPDDEMAKERHNSFGKTEMWYIVDAEKDAELIVGFNQAMDKTKYLQALEQGTLRSVLNFEKAAIGDVFHLPAGRIHATGSGILFAEIQQTSDVTYRIYDWDRKDDQGNERELHTELAADSIDFDFINQFKTQYQHEQNKGNKIVDCEYFTTNLLPITEGLIRDYSMLDSFVILMAVDGNVSIGYAKDESPTILNKGETCLCPSVIQNIVINLVSERAQLLEVYIGN